MLANSNTVEVITLVYAASAKKNKGSDILDFDRKIIFSEQDNANYFLLISSFSLNTVKFQNRQNNLFFTKDVLAIPVRAIFRYATQAF